MHMMDGLHPQIRQGDLFSCSQCFVYFRIEVPGRIKWYPTRTNNVTRMNYCCRKARNMREAEQPGFDGCFINSIFTKRPAELGFICRDLYTAAMHPYCAAMQEVLYF